MKAARQTNLSPQEMKAVHLFKKKVKALTKTKLGGLTLFGSRCRGEGDSDSDVDILVIISKMDEKLKIKIWDIAYKIFDDTDIMISPLVLDVSQYSRLLSHERLIAKTIEKEGVPL